MLEWGRARSALTLGRPTGVVFSLSCENQSVHNASLPLLLIRFYGLIRIAATGLFRFDGRCVVPYYMNGRLDRGGARTTPLSRLPVPLLLVSSRPRLPSSFVRPRPTISGAM